MALEARPLLLRQKMAPNRQLLNLEIQASELSGKFLSPRSARRRQSIYVLALIFQQAPLRWTQNPGTCLYEKIPWDLQTAYFYQYDLLIEG